MALDQAKRALESGQLKEAIVALLEAWRAVPDPRIADVLDGLSRRSQRAPIQGKNQAALTQAFLERAAEKNPLDVPRLAEVIGTTRSQQMVEQLEALLEWPADPRWTTPFLRLLTNPPFTGLGTQSAWRRLFKLLQQTADPRLLERLPTLDFAALLVRPGQANVEAFAAEFFTERRDAVLTAVRKKHPSTAPRIAKEDDATLASLERLVASDTVAQLEAQVFAAPASSDAPTVLADHLLEAGGERGEFMALQQQRLTSRVTEDQEAREEALLEKHATTWLGSLATVVEPSTVRFERGFPAAVELTTSQPALLASVANDPAWATVRHLHLHNDVSPDFLRAPALKQLEAVTLIREEGARALLNARDSWPWRRVAGRGYQGTTSVPNDVLLEAAAPLAGTLHEVCFTSRATKAHRAKAEALLASGGVVRVSKEGPRVPLPD